MACLRATGRKVYPDNPMAVARYRDRRSAAGRKPGKGDAAVGRHLPDQGTVKVGCPS